MLHSVVGLAAVLTSIGSVLDNISHASTLHLVTAYLGVVIGGITFTGSIVAFLKLAGRMSSKPLMLPGKHIINSAVLGANAIAMVNVTQFFVLTSIPILYIGWIRHRSSSCPCYCCGVSWSEYGAQLRTRLYHNCRHWRS